MARRILVTGATGYIAGHIIARLLDRGEEVVGSARSAAKDGSLRDALATVLSDPAALGRYRTVELDLTADVGWQQAMDGIDVLIHTASPFPLVQPKDPEEVIRPAVEGARRALRAARDAGVSRVVLTSSSVAIMGSREKERFDETDWTPVGPEVSPYARSKTLAERAAWDFVRDDAPDMKLAVINPTFVQGAPIGAGYGTSVGVIERLIKGRDPMLPRVGFPVCDVGDVAEAHLRAIDAPDAAGHRHLIIDRFLWFRDIADIVRETVPEARPARLVAPDLIVRFLGLFDPSIATILPDLGKRKTGDNSRMRNVLGIDPRDARDSIAETARWLAKRGS